MLDFRSPIWHVGFYLGQMTSWILPWPNDKSDRPNDKLDFTLAKWQVRSAKWQVGFYLGQMTSWILPCPNDKSASKPASQRSQPASAASQPAQPASAASQRSQPAQPASQPASKRSQPAQPAPAKKVWTFFFMSEQPWGKSAVCLWNCRF